MTMGVWQLLIKLATVSSFENTNISQTSLQQENTMFSKPSGNGQTMYFAYGSNLQMKQMAKRCPESRLIGSATLHSYRWQINERGYANVVADSQSSVEGICYLLSDKDEARLDRSEGVHTGAYEKEELHVELVCAPVAFVGRDVEQIVNDGSLDTLCRNAEEQDRWGDNHRRSSSVPVERRSRTILDGPRKQGEFAKALVYLSTSYTRDGPPRDEYIDRMNLGLIDALALGVSRRFVNNTIKPRISIKPKQRPRGKGTIAARSKQPKATQESERRPTRGRRTHPASRVDVIHGDGYDLSYVSGPVSQERMSFEY
jgi:gamma-glutamylcyclotransferase